MVPSEPIRMLITMRRPFTSTPPVPVIGRCSPATSIEPLIATCIVDTAEVLVYAAFKASAGVRSAARVGDAAGLAACDEPSLELAHAASEPAATVIVAIPLNQRRRMIFPPVLDIRRK